MPLIGLGTYKIDTEDAIKSAFDLGYRAFDCAAMYGNEALVGAALKSVIDDGRREELFLVSKVWPTAHRPANSRASCLKSIADLGCGYLDVLYLHWPESWLPGSDIKDPATIQPDPEVDLEKAWRGLEALVDEGLVKGLGLSNSSLTQVEQVLGFARHPPVVHQIELHPLLAQRKMCGVCYRRGIVCVAHSPLGSHKTKEVLDDPVVAEIAAEVSKTPAQVLLKYNLQRGVAVIPKAASLVRQRENFEGMFDWKLSNEQKAQLDVLDRGQRFISYPWKDWGSPEDGGAPKPSKVLAAVGGGMA